MCFIYAIAGHGVMYESTAHFVLNEYNDKTNWYRLYPFENVIRGFAKTYPHSYHVGFNICCRQDFNPSKLSRTLCFKAGNKS